MPDTPFAHLVFVDFENVPTVDLERIDRHSVFVTLLIGKNQTRLDTRLVTQIHRHAAQVRLIEVGASGRNALDLVLAHYLGQAVIEHPNATLHIVSKDKDFEPLIAHLRAVAVAVSRSESFSALPFLAPRRPTSPVRKASAATKKTVAPPPPPSLAQDRLERLVVRLMNNAAPRPKKKERLLHHIEAALGKESSPEKIAAVLDELQARQVLAIAANDKVVYSRHH